MSRTCTICSHPQHAEIDAAFAAGTPYRSIAKRFGTSEAAMYRHTAEHIAQDIKDSSIAQSEARAFDVVKQLREINAVTLAILKESRAIKANGLALQAVDRIHKQLELQAKLLGDIDQPQVNIWLTPEWHTIRSTIVSSLAPFPEARVACASALSQLNAGLN